MEKLAGQDTIFTRAFDSMTDALGFFADKIWDVASVTIGIILRDAIEWAIGALKELASAAFEAGAEFQLIEMRLRGFNLQNAINSGLEYNAAMAKSIELTREQMDWLMKLAALTPYDAKDIANVFSLAMSYGFTADEAKQLTKNTTDFAAAMGLGSTEIQRVIINLGQMVQRGKITTREMNDLARGSFVPLADVLDRVAKKLNVTTEELTKMISKPGGGVDPQLFIDAFNEMIEGEERFADAGYRMAHTFKGAFENIKQTASDLLGYFILLPGFLDPIGKKLGDIMDEVGKRWDEVTAAAGRIGSALSEIVVTLLDIFFPGASTVVDGLVGSLNNVADWIAEHKVEIVNFFAGTPEGEGREGGLAGFVKDFWNTLVGVYNWLVAAWPYVLAFFSELGRIIQEEIVPWIQDTLIPAFNEIKNWVEEHGDKINEFFRTLGEIIGHVIGDLLGGPKEGKGEGGISGFLDDLLPIMQWIIDNKDQIADFIQGWIRLWITIELIKTVLQFVLGLIAGLFTFDLAGWGNSFMALTLIIEGAIAGFTNMYNSVSAIDWKGLGESILGGIIAGIQSLLDAALGLFSGKASKGKEGKGGGGLWQSIIDSAAEIDWIALGKSLIIGMVEGVVSESYNLIAAVVNAVLQAWQAAKDALGIKSPSKMFFEIGIEMAQGMTGGIENAADALLQKTSEMSMDAWAIAKSIQEREQSTMSILNPSTINNSTAVNNNYNLVINSQANHESIIQDFQVLASI